MCLQKFLHCRDKKNINASLQPLHDLYKSDKLVRGAHKLLFIQKGKRLSPSSDLRDCFHCILDLQLLPETLGATRKLSVSQAFDWFTWFPPEQTIIHLI